MNDTQRHLSRRQAFALAAALALTVVTGGAAVTGLRHAPAPSHPATQVVQVAPAPQAPPAAPPGEELD
jgi:hypothetical protein